MKMEGNTLKTENVQFRHEGVQAAASLLRNLDTLGMTNHDKIVIRFIPTASTVAPKDKYQLLGGVGWKVATMEAFRNTVMQGRQESNIERLASIPLLTDGDPIYPFAVRGELVTFPDIGSFKSGMQGDEGSAAEEFDAAVATLMTL